MNASVQIKAPVQRARHRFTLDDIFRMQEAGILKSPPKVELIEGDLIEVAAQNAPHMLAKQALMRLLSRLEPAVDFHVEGTLKLSDRNAPDPDLFVQPPGVRPDAVRGPDVLLVVEVSDSTLIDDLGYKAELYARHGVREYWVVDCVGRVLHVHTQPRPEGYASRRECRDDMPAIAQFVPGLRVAMSDLPPF